MSTGRRLESIKLALPKGKLLPATACLLNHIGLEFENYTQTTRVYRLQSAELPHISAKIFQEKDIPIQVAVGNYDFGICGLDWIEELLAKYPSSALVKVADLGYDKGNLYLAASQYGDVDVQEMSVRQENWRIVTEYPNLAEAAALNLRLRRFHVFPVWGAAEAYPPENADLALLLTKGETAIKELNLLPLKALLSTSAFLIANKESWQTKDISQIINYFKLGLEMQSKPWLEIKPKHTKSHNGFRYEPDGDKIWLAVPDGHQQGPALKFLTQAGIEIEGYAGDVVHRRPNCNLDWVNVKVIRPQDMPLQVANGNFDLAVTGKDWLLDHLSRFPTSPATELVELGFGKVKVVAVVTQNTPADNIDDLKQMQAGKMQRLRVASEYVNIADKYLHDNHVRWYKMIPTWGASEALLPEDADLLIENTQTGKTLAEHKLKIIDTLFESAACLIGNKNSLNYSNKKDKIATLVEIFRKATKDNIA